MMPSCPPRTASLSRSTGETSVKLELVLEGTGQSTISTGFGMAHFDLRLTCSGDMHVDAHHTTEDVALCLGKALRDALGDRKGIARTGWARVPMDEALADVTVDLSGRPWLEFRGDELLPPVMAGEEKDVWREFYKAFASAAQCNLHISFQYGKNGHHLLESAAKGLGLALAQAVRRSDDRMPSTKGSLD